jgi:formiminoglutamase
MITVPKDTDSLTFLTTCEAKYVLFGIPEDIGIRANFRPSAFV